MTARMNPQQETMPDEENDPVYEALKRSAPYIDAGFIPGTTFRPSSIMIMRYLAVRTMNTADAIEHSGAMARAWLDEARRRWSLGFSGNPFTPEPIPRKAQ